MEGPYTKDYAGRMAHNLRFGVVLQGVDPPGRFVELVRSIEAAGFRLDDVRAFQRFDTVAPAFPMRLVRAHKPA